MSNLTGLNTLKQIQQALATMSYDLNEMYQRSLDRIQKQNPERCQLGLRVLFWVSNVQRPLSVGELRHALAIEPELGFMGEENLSSEKVILSSCLGLVTREDGQNTVHLVHLTLREFLRSHWPQDLGMPQVDIAQTCLACLNFGTLHKNLTAVLEECQLLLTMVLYGPLEKSSDPRNSREYQMWSTGQS